MSTFVTIRDFRRLLPEFSDSSDYIDENVQLWLDIGNAQLNEARWQTLYTLGVSLYVAHNLVLSRPAQKTAQRGGTPGSQVGPVASKSVGGVSVSYNTGATTLQDGADFNLSTYGIRFLNFARMIGAGGMQIVGTDAANVSEADLLKGDSRPQFSG